MSHKDTLKEIEEVEVKLKELRERAHEEYLSEGRGRPLAERLCYAAYARCKCGAGFAYDPYGEGTEPFYGPDAWECSKILLKTADPAVRHSAAMPFMFYEVKSEDQPSAGGATTRPKE